MSEEKRPEWMTSISANINPDDYLSGRKIDKTFELAQEEKAKRAKEIREDLIANNKLTLAADPILELERRKQQLKLELMSNPLKLRKFREHLLKEEREKRGESSQVKVHRDSERSTKKDVVSSGERQDDRDNYRGRRRSPSSSHSSSSSSHRDRHKSRSRDHDKRSHHSRHKHRRSPERDHKISDRPRHKNKSSHRSRSRESHSRRHSSSRHRKSPVRSRHSGR